MRATSMACLAVGVLFLIAWLIAAADKNSDAVGGLAAAIVFFGVSWWTHREDAKKRGAPDEPWAPIALARRVRKR